METSTFESSSSILFPNNDAQNVSSQMAILSATTNSPVVPDYYELLNRLFIGCLVILIMIANVLMGAELDITIIVSTVKRPVAPAIGFLAQFFLMPLLSYSIGMLVLSTNGQHLLALGLFVTGCSPGGGASNYWTLLLGGNANLSITMTFVSTIGALVMMPFWISLFGANLVQAINPSVKVLIPYRKMLISLCAMILPLFVGLLIAKFRPNWAAKMRKLMRPFIISVLVFIIIFGVISNWWLLQLITWRILLAGLLLPSCGFTFGCFVAIVMNQKAEDVTAIAIETGVQNTGIAIMMLKLTFPNAQGDLASLLPIVVACNTPILLLLAYVICRAFRKGNGTNNEEGQQKTCALSSVSIGTRKISCHQQRIGDGGTKCHHPHQHKHTQCYQPIGMEGQQSSSSSSSTEALVKNPPMIKLMNPKKIQEPLLQ